VRTTNPDTGKEKIDQRMVRIAKPVARVSTLCIHLQTADERGSFKVNKEEHLSPILGTQSLLEAGAKMQLNQVGDDDDWRKAQEPALMRLIASELGVNAKQIANFELGLFDCQPASLGGISSEFLNAARLDNLATCFIALESIKSKSTDLDDDDMISLIALFDHEEIGSQSTHGAGSPVMSEAVKRITSAFSDNTNVESYSSAVRRSFVMSVDMAHAVHPNYASKHEKNHGPKMNAGFVLKTNQNQRCKSI
jgi:aspartyl aminopeptidase